MAKPIPAPQINTTDGPISTVQAGDIAIQGVGPGMATRDHQHAVETAVPVPIGTVESEGTGTALARADHTHSLNGTPVPYLPETVISLDAVAAADPVAWSATADRVFRGRADSAARARIFAVAAAAAPAGPVPVIRRGRAEGVLTGATPGVPLFLSATGGLQTALPIGVGDRVVVVGYASSPTDLEVLIHEVPVTHRLRYGVEPVGARNGVNHSYVVPEYFVAEALRVYLNGQRLYAGTGNDFEMLESGGVGSGYDTIVMAIAPLSVDRLILDYVTTTTV